MAECEVLKDHFGWKKGDHVEAFEDRLKELVSNGVVKVLVPDVKVEPKVESVKEVKKYGRKS